MARAACAYACAACCTCTLANISRFVQRRRWNQQPRRGASTTMRSSSAAAGSGPRQHVLEGRAGQPPTTATGPPAAGWQHGPLRPELSACPSRKILSASPRARRRSSQPSHGGTACRTKAELPQTAQPIFCGDTASACSRPVWECTALPPVAFRIALAQRTRDIPPRFCGGRTASFSKIDGTRHDTSHRSPSRELGRNSSLRTKTLHTPAFSRIPRSKKSIVRSRSPPRRRCPASGTPRRWRHTTPPSSPRECLRRSPACS